MNKKSSTILINIYISQKHLLNNLSPKHIHKFYNYIVLLLIYYNIQLIHVYLYQYQTTIYYNNSNLTSTKI